MVRISRLSDYGIQLLGAFARQPGEALTSHQVADAAAIPEPTVRKLLKVLSKAQLLVSRRGVQGGYRLARAPEQITVAEIITAVEGPIAMTECNVPGGEACDRSKDCRMKGTWHTVNQLIQGTLSNLTLSQMVAPPAPQPVAEPTSGGTP
ncbi:MAG TPA: SUF system Fe-S cluster assembly regulator [Myxococcales bacterium]|jgi:FeS assembly SUF system regulator